MSARLIIARSRVRAVAGTASTLVLLGGLIAAGAVIVLAALAVAGSLAGSLFVWSKASQRMRKGPSLS
ncbi:MAG: hypothetical protein EXQ95_04885 [Alphaproteobacteria bacterium]|nr:hypothetical protein [Alphaproteobacteria bacterium]